MNTAIILAAHGSSKDERINRPMFGLADAISNRLTNVMVSPAFLDGTPDIRKIVNQIDQENLLVIPFMTSQGYYTNVVFPRAFQHSSKKVRIAEAIGANSKLFEFVEQRVRHLEKTLDWSTNFEIVVVGHGTRKNKNSCRTTIDLVKNLRERFLHRKIHFAFIDQNPDLGHVVSRIESPNVLVIPFLMGLGPHTSVDVPAAFGITEFADQLFKPDFEFPFVSTRDNQLKIDQPTIDAVAYDSPIGSYPELAELCVEIYQQYISTAVDGRFKVGEVA